MLTEICAYLHNYFDYERHSGEISIVSGEIFCNGEKITLEEGQYFALFRSRIPLGVFDVVPADKNFVGSVWLMDVPKAILDANTWAKEWNAKNGGATSEANSVFQSESFGGYSYNKGTNTSGKGGMSVFDNAQFARMLNPYRKLP
ncbi:MAG: hypothetical protein IKO76_06285 [Butyrivibrio sp.]|nr:hypothetical protein [Butyrivibrio sp.]